MAQSLGGFRSLGVSPQLRRKSLTAPALGTNTAIAAAVGLTGSAQAGITAGITNPDFPRNLVVKGNAAGIAGNVVIHGASDDGAAISETIALNSASAVAGNKAFKTVTGYDLPAKTNSSGDTVSLGTGPKLGLGRKLARNTVIAAYLGGVKEGTAPTVAVSSSAVESNTAALNSALDGAAEVVLDFYDA